MQQWDNKKYFPTKGFFCTLLGKEKQKEKTTFESSTMKSGNSKNTDYVIKMPLSPNWLTKVSSMVIIFKFPTI